MPRRKGLMTASDDFLFVYLGLFLSLSEFLSLESRTKLQLKCQRDHVTPAMQGQPWHLKNCFLFKVSSCLKAFLQHTFLIKLFYFSTRFKFVAYLLYCGHSILLLQLRYLVITGYVRKDNVCIGFHCQCLNGRLMAKYFKRITSIPSHK